jgi:hypothetical protein
MDRWVPTQAAQGRPQATAGTRYSDETRELARQLWTWRCDRNAARTVAELAKELSPDEPLPTEQAVRLWVNGENWAIRADDDIAALAPAIQRRDAARMFVLRSKAIDDIAAIQHGELAGKDAQLRQSNAFGILNRTGMSDKEPAAPSLAGGQPTNALTPQAASALSQEERNRLRQELEQRRARQEEP